MNLAKNISALDSLRTRNPDGWKEVVNILFEISYLLIIDISIESEAVNYELNQVKEKHYESKCIFIVENVNDLKSLRTKMGDEFNIDNSLEICTKNNLIDVIKNQIRILENY